MRRSALDVLMGAGSDLACARLWRGYVAHSLLFYRQNALGRFSGIFRLGDALPQGSADAPRRVNKLPAGPGWSAALAALRQNDPKKARRLLTQAVSLDPANADFLVLRGLWGHERYWGSFRFSDEALADFEAAAAKDPSNHWAWLLAGLAHEMHRRYTWALESLARAAALEPRWAWPLVLMGICRWYRAQFSEAAAELARAAALAPRDPLPLLFLARAKADLRDPSMVADLDLALSLSPRCGFARSWRGRAIFVLNKAPDALADLLEACRLVPDYDRGPSWLGVSYLELGRHAEAREQLELARELNPFYPTTLYPLARARRLMGDWAGTGRALKEGMEVDRQGLWVEHRIHMSHPNQACLRSLEDLDRYLEKRPASGWAWAWRGQTRLLLKDYALALRDLEKAIALSPQDPWPLLWRGETRRRLGRAAEALRDFDAALRLSPDLSWALAGRGFCLLELGRDASALAALDDSLALQGRCPQALGWRGEALARLGRWEEAAASLEQALRRYPHAPWLHGRLWRCRARLGDWEGTLKSLEAWSSASGGRSDRVWALRGWAEGKLGRKDGALDALARALSLNASQPLALAEGRAWTEGGAPGTLSPEEAEALCAEDPKSYFEPRRLAEAPPPASRRDLQGQLVSAWRKLEAGDKDGAVEEASRCLDESLDPFCAPALWLRARASEAAHA